MARSNPPPRPPRSAPFGDFLRQQREKQGIALVDVAQRTRIKERWLQLIDESDVEQLPADVFVRGFVKAYAVAVGADAKEAGRLLADRLAERQARAEHLDLPPELLSSINDVMSVDDDDAIVKGDGRRRMGMALAVIVLLIAATLAISLLLRRPVPPAGSISSGTAPTLFLEHTRV